MNEPLQSFTLNRINRDAHPTIYGGILLYKDGDENENAALHINNIVGLIEAGVDVVIDDDVKEEINKDETDQMNLAKKRYQEYLDELSKAANANKS